MAHPTQVRLTERTNKKLQKFYAETGLKQADVIRLAMDRVFDQLPDNAALSKALLAAKAKEAQE